MFQASIKRSPLDTGRKLKVHKAFKRRPGRFLNVLCTFNLRPVSTRSTVTLEITDQCLKRCFDQGKVIKPNWTIPVLRNLGDYNLNFISEKSPLGCQVFSIFPSSQSFYEISNSLDDLYMKFVLLNINSCLT